MSEHPEQGAGAPELSTADVEAVRHLKESHAKIRAELGRVIVGQDKVIDELLISIFSRGHCLLVGVPGLAKTLMIHSLANALSLTFKRIQFTPDLMPADITGTEVIQEDPDTHDRRFKFLHGPIFANVILADEINRTPPKTQAALLEAMQEHKVTAGGQRYTLHEPFFVLATQNPIEQEGTYPLPEAQLDRFMFMILVDYPSEDEEFEIVRTTTATFDMELERTLSGEDILRLQRIVREVPVADHVIRYAMSLARMSRPNNPKAPQFVKDWVSWGAGPRASQYLVLGGKARAVLDGRYYVSCDDIRSVAHPVLRHRIINNFNAEAEGVTPDDLVDRLLETVPEKLSETLSDERVPEVLGSENPVENRQA
ncbi:MAG TPA: MoxR family ATPase [Planctomycetota bacterium]|nr:MoxR family ATPase [Planctomycetota bacterium]